MVRYLIRILVLATASVLAALPVRAGGAPPTTRSCLTVSAALRIPAPILTAPRLTALVADDAGRAFILAGSDADPQGTCPARVVTLDARSGRVLHIQSLPGVTHPSTAVPFSTFLAVAAAPHLLLAISTLASGVGDGYLSEIDTRNGRLVRTVRVGPNPGSVAVDPVRYRAYVTVAARPGQYVSDGVAVIALTRGVVLRTFSVRTQDMVVEASTARVFLVQSGGVSVLNEMTGTLQVVALPGGYRDYAGYALDQRTERLFVAQVGRAPPHGPTSNPPSTVSTLNARTGTLVRSVEDPAGLLAAGIVADPVAGFVLAPGQGPSRVALVLDARTGDVRRTVRLPFAVADTPNLTTVDPRTGTLYLFGGSGLEALSSNLRLARTLSASHPLLPLALALSPVSGRVLTLEWDMPPVPYRDTAWLLNGTR